MLVIGAHSRGPAHRMSVGGVGCYPPTACDSTSPAAAITTCGPGTERGRPVRGLARERTATASIVGGLPGCGAAEDPYCLVGPAEAGDLRRELFGEGSTDCSRGTHRVTDRSSRVLHRGLQCLRGRRGARDVRPTCLLRAVVSHSRRPMQDSEPPVHVTNSGATIPSPRTMSAVARFARPCGAGSTTR